MKHSMNKVNNLRDDWIKDKQSHQDSVQAVFHDYLRCLKRLIINNGKWHLIFLSGRGNVGIWGGMQKI